MKCSTPSCPNAVSHAVRADETLTLLVCATCAITGRVFNLPVWRLRSASPRHGGSPGPDEGSTERE